ncbi:hypothetical protein L798_03849 [Zootermopsis nevadensis]|uniref:Uncharacterized protein n=1 Tax=Zootermopsis nevadensis TaxID=136037 RepID=A0A067RLI7_ZOONE|nr:hypothetical protein L798_03849 [Zootermopsis nevadensis]
MYKIDDIDVKRVHKAEYMRQYRKRKKIEVLDKELKVPKKIPKTNAERIREHKNRKRQLLSNNKPKVPKEIPKTNAERIREYRNRKKQLLQVNASTSTASTSVPTGFAQPRYDNATEYFHKQFMREE